MSPCVDPNEFDRVWPWIMAALSTEVGGVSHTKEEIWDLIASGDAQLWTTPLAANLTTGVFYPRRKYMLSWAGGGSLKELTRIILPSMEDWARANDYDYIIGSGRKAWGLVLQRFGFEEVYTNFAKALRSK